MENSNSKREYTNLASEFYVLSMLNRLQIDCYLTLGNKKAIDIIVLKERKQFSIDVKGAREGTWMISSKNKPPLEKENHFYVLVNYNDKIEVPTNIPEVYIIPSIEIRRWLILNKAGYEIYYSKKNLDEMKSYKDVWDPFLSLSKTPKGFKTL